MEDYLADIIDLTGDGQLAPAWPGHARSVGSITSISIHHEAQNRPHDYDSIARYRQEATYQNTVSVPGSKGLQYHYKIDNVGQIFKVRPHETWLWTVGSDENVTTLAICLDGNFETQQPTREQFEALYQLLKNLCTEHPEFPATWKDVRPHCDFSATACPGGNLRNRIFAIVDEASAKAQLLNVGEYDWPEYQPGYQPTPPLPPVPPIVDSLSKPPATPPVQYEEPKTAEKPVEKPSTPAPAPVEKFNWKKYKKAFVAVAGLIVTVATALLGAADPITLALIQVFTVLGVYGVKNED